MGIKKKQEEFLFTKCNNSQYLRLLIKQSIDIYNNNRPHWALNMETPNFSHTKQKTDRYKPIGSVNILV